MAAAGGIDGSSSDNPVEINVVAMVDIIFCLVIFFMCSFHFKQLEGKVDSWLPDKGRPGPPTRPVILEEIRVFMRWDPATKSVIRKVGNRNPVSSDEELMEMVLQRGEDYKKLGKTGFPVIIDATPDVPWRDVVHVMDLCKGKEIAQLEFAAPYEAK